MPKTKTTHWSAENADAQIHLDLGVHSVMINGQPFDEFRTLTEAKACAQGEFPDRKLKWLK